MWSRRLSVQSVLGNISLAYVDRSGESPGEIKYLSGAIAAKRGSHSLRPHKPCSKLRVCGWKRGGNWGTGGDESEEVMKSTTQVAATMEATLHFLDGAEISSDKNIGPLQSRVRWRKIRKPCRSRNRTSEPTPPQHIIN